MRHSTLLTEFTDISQRLEYLVAHSSQLVFVTGEDAAVQQGFVEAFLGQQSNSANVAFLTARRGKNNQYYRQQLAQQLNLKGTRNQSFVQAFGAREDKSQPVIIAITSAENVSEEVLRELWDLVLQNRFTRNGEQVNILMFGDHEWAEEVKSWLPTNNNDKPVLLTTQTLEYNEETEVEGDLDDLIANRRKLFQQRMQARAQGDDAEASLLSTWWFKLSIAAVFLVSFSSILIWQYFDVTESALKEFTQFLFQEETQSQDMASLTEESGSENVTDINQRVAANFSAAMESIESASAENQEQSQEVEQVKVNTFTQQSADSPNSEFIADISAEQLKQLRDSGSISPQEETEVSIVSANNNPGTQQESPQELALQSSILDALNELDSLSLEPMESRIEPANSLEPMESRLEPANSLEPMESRLESADSPEPINSRPEPINSRPEPINSPEPTNIRAESVSSAPELVETNQQVAVEASEPVTSLPESQQILPEPGPVPETAVIETPQNLSESTETATIIPEVQNRVDTEVNDFQVEDEAALAIDGETAQALPFQPEQSQITSSQEPVYQYHESILLELPNDSYALQISGITTESLLEEFLVDNRLLNSVWVYKTQRYGGDWFVVLVNQSFDTLEQARSSVSLLSPELQAVEPFAKSVAAIRNEILQ